MRTKSTRENFPRPSWQKLCTELEGYDLINTIYHDDFTGIDHFHYEYKFKYRNHNAKFCVKDFTHLRQGASISGLHLDYVEYFLKLGFEYQHPPRVEILLRKWHKVFALWSKIRMHHVSLKNTPLYRVYLFESNKPGLAARLRQDVLFLADDPNDSFITNNNVDPKNGAYSLDFTCPEWIDDYDQLKSILDNTSQLFGQSLGIEALAG